MSNAEKICEFDYYIRDLTADVKTKIQIKDTTTISIAELVANEFGKPLFRVFCKEDQSNIFIVNKKLDLKIKILEDQEYKLGDFLVTCEEQVAL